MPNVADQPTPPEAAPGALRTVRRGDTEYTLLGTAHVSRQSAEEVRALIDTGDFDAVAIELCPTRLQHLTGQSELEDLDLFQVIRQRKAGLVAASLALGAYQQRVADQLGVRPGLEMLAAVDGAKVRDLPVILIDRDIGLTLRRLLRCVPWRQRLNLFAGLLSSLFSRQRLEPGDIERLKESDQLEAAFTEFADRAPGLYRALIDERDRYMAARLEQQSAAHRRVLVVIGAGHVAGIARVLESADHPDPARELAALEHLPPPSRLLRALPWLVVALVLSAFGVGFARSPELGWQLLLDWVVINGGLAALGVTLALGHPLTVLGSFLAAPLTSLNPTVGVGMVAMGLEVSLRRPQVSHLRRLRADIAQWRGWWRNRVARAFVVFVFASVGSAVGTYVAGARLAGQLF